MEENKLTYFINKPARLDAWFARAQRSLQAKD